MRRPPLDTIAVTCGELIRNARERVEYAGVSG
jgi:hypothetical protein